MLLLCNLLGFHEALARISNLFVRDPVHQTVVFLKSKNIAVEGILNLRTFQLMFLPDWLEDDGRGENPCARNRSEQWAEIRPEEKHEGGRQGQQDRKPCSGKVPAVSNRIDMCLGNLSPQVALRILSSTDSLHGWRPLVTHSAHPY